MSVHTDAMLAAARAERLLAERAFWQRRLSYLSRQVDQALAERDRIDLELTGSEIVVSWGWQAA